MRRATTAGRFSRAPGGISMTDLDWSRLYLQRREVAREFGGIWSLPLAKRYHIVLAELPAPRSVLDLGAGDRSLQRRVSALWPEAEYKSCDIDPSADHDFAGIDEVRGTYDLICVLEMIEHVPLDEAGRILEQCHGLLGDGGMIALTTPNVYYPPAFLRDATHRTPFCYDELGGLLQLCGFEVTHVYRLHQDALFKKLAKRYLFYPLYRLLGLDFAHGVMVVARKR